MSVLTASTRHTGQKSRRLSLKDAPLSAWFAIVILAGFAILIIFGPWLTPHSPTVGDLTNTLAPPSLSHPLGTDSAGRDLLSRIIYGARLSLLGPLLVVIAAIVVGVPLGVAAGYMGSWIDLALSRAFDLFFAFPALLMAAVVVATFGAGFVTIVIAVSLIYIPLMARIVRGAVIVERHKPYVEAARVQGNSALRVVARHIAPNLSTLTFGTSTLYFGYALLDLAALSFLGFGVQPPATDWGSMLWIANQDIFLSVTGVIGPALAIVLAVVSLNLLGDWIISRSESR